MLKKDALYSAPVMLGILLAFVLLIVGSWYLRFSIRGNLQQRERAAPPAATGAPAPPADGK